MARKALGKGFEGKGLGALVPTMEADLPGLLNLDVDRVKANRYQPRQIFDEAALESLAASLKQHGLIQPITVRKDEAGGYELISGERRWRAARRAGLSKIPAILKEVADQELMEWALLENLQREDLNPIEKAKAYENLISEFSLTQEAIASRMGINRSSVSNFLRLLHLPKELWEEISEGRLSMGHAKALLSLESKSEQLKLAEEIEARGLSVRQAEAAVHQIKKQPVLKRVVKPLSQGERADLSALEDRLRRSLGTKVKLSQQGNAGEIRITYYSLNDLDRILEKLT
ncbi:Chromosome (plasmid) partitioning protein ParB [hydrothermal vent metagenome]|uniref:Chromosome (Plasmid) partitioning protein ParB n=1 Tax=hydrothermal vent metagenome TaxID=652676 RepID=A0A3B1DBH9_9ZZZZ